MFSFRSLIISLSATLLVWAELSSAQKVFFQSPSPGAVIKTNQQLTVILAQDTNSSSVITVAFSFGLHAGGNNDTGALGQPYLGTIPVGEQGTVLDYSGLNPSYNITLAVPGADAFPDGMSSEYQLRVAQHVIVGGNAVPQVSVIGLDVTVSQAKS